MMHLEANGAVIIIYVNKIRAIFHKYKIFIICTKATKQVRRKNFYLFLHFYRKNPQFFAVVKRNLEVEKKANPLLWVIADIQVIEYNYYQ